MICGQFLLATRQTLALPLLGDQWERETDDWTTTLTWISLLSSRMASKAALSHNIDWMEKVNPLGTISVNGAMAIRRLFEDGISARIWFIRSRQETPPPQFASGHIVGKADGFDEISSARKTDRNRPVTRIPSRRGINKYLCWFAVASTHVKSLRHRPASSKSTLQ